jgi:YVTN family beta-propeller protein
MISYFSNYTNIKKIWRLPIFNNLVLFCILSSLLFFYTYIQSTQESNNSFLDPYNKFKKEKNNKLALVYGQLNEKSIISGFNTGSYPIGIAINPLTHKIYVANEYSNTISVFNSYTDKLEQTIKAGIFPYNIDINLFNNRIYVTNRGSNDISVIDGSTNLLIDQIHIGLSPVGVAVDPSSNWIYVTNIDYNSISIIDGITNKVINTINNISTPYGINVNPVSKKIYVSNIANSTITIINSNNYKVIKNVRVEKAPVGIDIDIAQNLVFITNYSSNSLSIINGTNDSLIKTIKVGGSPVGVKINPVSKKIYVSNIQSNTVSVINETGFKKIKDIFVNPSLITERNEFPFNIPTNVKFPLMASYVGMDPLTNLIYITNTASNTISLINGKDDENIIRMDFEIKPDNAGFIECNGIKNINRNTMIINTNHTTICKAVPERGYSFDIWSGLISSEENPVKFTSTEYGRIIANFKPTLSIDQYIFLIGGITGFISIILGWFFKGRQRRKFNKFIEKIDGNIENTEILEKEKIIQKMENLRRNIFSSYRKGSLTDFQFDYLDKRLLNYIEKINKM